MNKNALKLQVIPTVTMLVWSLPFHTYFTIHLKCKWLTYSLKWKEKWVHCATILWLLGLSQLVHKTRHLTNIYASGKFPCTQMVLISLWLCPQAITIIFRLVIFRRAFTSLRYMYLFWSNLYVSVIHSKIRHCFISCFIWWVSSHIIWSFYLLAKWSLLPGFTCFLTFTIKLMDSCRLGPGLCRTASEWL